MPECYCNGAMSSGLPLSHPRGLPGCKYAVPDDPTCDICGVPRDAFGKHRDGIPSPFMYHEWRSGTLDRPHIPGTDYYDGRDGSIEADDDDEDRIEAESRAMHEYDDEAYAAGDEAIERRREEMRDLVEWQHGLLER